MRLCINMLIFTHNLGNWLIETDHSMAFSDLQCNLETLFILTTEDVYHPLVVGGKSPIILPLPSPLSISGPFPFLSVPPSCSLPFCCSQGPGERLSSPVGLGRALPPQACILVLNYRTLLMMLAAFY